MTQEKREGYHFKNPMLFLSLPYSIIKSAITGSNPPEFDCPQRRALHEECSKTQGFDKLTVEPVNILLHHKQTPLTRDSFHAIKNDIAHTQSWDSNFSHDERTTFYSQQSKHQHNIAKTFYEADEHEGSFMHSRLGNDSLPPT